MVSAAAAAAYTVQDPDDGVLGDTFIFVPEAEVTEGETSPSEATDWIEQTRAERGLDEPLMSETGKTALESLEKPPLAEDEVRFSVDSEEGWIEYLIKDETVVLYNDAVVEYGENVLLAETIYLKSSQDLVVAEGRAVLIDPTQEMLAVRMAYDTKRKKGVAYEGASEADMGYYKGKRIKQTGKDEFCIYWGSFTTDELAYPNYRFWSPKIKVYIEDKVVARPAVLFGGEVPIAVAPYYFFYLEKGRRTGIIPPYIRYIEGKDFTVNNGFYWVINDYSDLTLYLDYNSRNGWKKSANFVYLYGSKSTVNNLYVAQQRERDTYINWWKIYANHRQDFSDSLIGLVKLDIRNNTYYDKYFLEDLEVRTQDSLDSFATLTKNWDNYSAIVAFDHSEVTSEDLTPERSFNSEGSIEKSDDVLPRVSFSGTRGEILDTRIYYQFTADAANYYKNGENTLKKGSATGSLSRPFKLIRVIRVDPSLSLSDSVYDRDIYGKNVRNLFIWSSRVSNSTKIYGLFNIGESKLRHIINPNVTYIYQPFIDQSWLINGATNTPKASYLTLALTQNLDLKLPESESEEETDSEEDIYERETGGVYGRGSSEKPAEYFKDVDSSIGSVINLFKWTLSTRYDLLDPATSPYANVKIKDGKRHYYRLGDLSSTVEIAPNLKDWYYFATEVNSEYDINDYSLERWSVATSLSFTTAGLVSTSDNGKTDNSWLGARDPYGGQKDPDSSDYDPNVYNIDRVTGSTYGAGEGMGEGWNISFTHNYAKSRWNIHNINSIKGAVSFDLTRKWRLGYDAYYDIEGDELTSEHYRIYRDLRHWEAEIRVSFESEEVIYWFQLRLKELPDVQLYGSRNRQW